MERASDEEDNGVSPELERCEEFLRRVEAHLRFQGLSPFTARVALAFLQVRTITNRKRISITS